MILIGSVIQNTFYEQLWITKTHRIVYIFYQGDKKNVSEPTYIRAIRLKAPREYTQY